MFKFKNVMIAAAALVSMAVPSLAFAGDLGREFKDQREQLHSARDRYHDLKMKFKNGEISRAYYLQQKQSIRDQIGDIKSTLEDLKEERASH